jgi:hypothetical protein
VQAIPPETSNFAIVGMFNVEITLISRDKPRNEHESDMLIIFEYKPIMVRDFVVNISFPPVDGVKICPMVTTLLSQMSHSKFQLTRVTIVIPKCIKDQNIYHLVLA